MLKKLFFILCGVKMGFLLFLIFFNFNPNFAGAVFNCLELKIDSEHEDKAYCVEELVKIEGELKDLLEKQKVQKKNTGTIKTDINYLNSKIKALKTKIKAHDLNIAQLKVSIKEKKIKIDDLFEEIENKHESLAQLLRNTNDLDTKNFAYLILADENLSDFYADFEFYGAIKKAVKTSVDEVQDIKLETEIVKSSLEKEKEDETDARFELNNVQEKVVKSEKEKKKLLSISEKKEKDYQKLAAEKKAQAEKIRAALFLLRDTDAIKFGTALNYAEIAEKITGVRPALVLAILKQETNLGGNVGTCNRISDPSSKSWENIMNPRDHSSYKRITSALGINTFGTPLSCPQKIGWGGAMGPSQFIPSTWELFAKRIANAVGIDGMPNPWDPFHAISATSIYLANLGASKGGYTAERNAACRYFSGSSCGRKHITQYGNSVINLAKKIQVDIDLIRD